jgi:von Willebrand factor type A domain
MTPNSKPENRLRVRCTPIFQQVSFFAGDDPLAQMLVEFEAESDQREARPKIPADIFLVLDVSGSMNAPDRYPLLRRAVQEFLQKIEPEDRVGMVVFSTASDLISPLLLGTDAYQNSTWLLDRMDKSPRMFGGGTYLGSGLQEALTQLQKSPPNRVRRVYVLTDGEIHDTEFCQSTLAPFREHRLEVHVYGFGTAFNAEKLKLLVSDQLGGSVKPICNEADIISTFAHIAEVNRRIIADDAVFTLSIDHEVDCGDAWAFRPQERYLGRVEGRSVSRAIGALEARRVYSFLVELRLPPAENLSPDDPKTNVGTATLSWSGGEERVTLYAHRHVSAQPAEDMTRVKEAFVILDLMRRKGDKAAEIIAMKARLELANREGRDVGLVEALQKQLDVLEGRTSARAISQADRQYLASDFSTRA